MCQTTLPSTCCPRGEPFTGNYALSIEYVNGLEMMFEPGD